MCSGFANMELKGLRCRKLFSSSIYVLPAINGSVRSCSCFYINHCLRKFTNGVCQKILAPPTLKNNREPCLLQCIRKMLRSFRTDSITLEIKCGECLWELLRDRLSIVMILMIMMERSLIEKNEKWSQFMFGKTVLDNTEGFYRWSRW